VLLWVLGGVLLTGCDRSSSVAPVESSKLHVLSSVYPLADVVRQVAGQQVEIEWFCENGQDPRDIHLSDEQQKHGHQADMIVSSGFREPWAGEMLDLRQQALRLLQPDATAAGHEGPDPHGALWLDPQVIKEMAEMVRLRLTLLDSKREADYRKNSEAFIKEVEAVDADFRSRLAPMRGRPFLSLRPTWGALADRYGLEEVAPIDTDPRKLTDADIRKLKDAATEHGTDVLVIDAALLPGVQRELAMRTGLRLLPLDPLGSSAPDGRSTWVRMMRYNLEQLVNGLKE
jgi:ABC-type Zn uptake system ZnuABC Zn-binding protein ZnuA